ncbi:hypothetical protein KP509_12G094000 [Ceratopteris richardii]|nr:hypothetical protein KP509_12G094000 [Ceratopteris richardii]
MVLCISAALYLFGALLMIWSPNVYLLLLARFVDGIGVGLAVTVAPLYISEVSPAEIRGALNTLPQLLGTFGMFLAFTMVFGISLTTSPQWRMMLWIMCIPAVVYLLLGIFYLPESPRWLVSKGKVQEAEEILQWLRNKTDILGELTLFLEGLDVGKAPFREEYFIHPANLAEDDSLSFKDDLHILLESPEDRCSWIATPISSYAGSQGFPSRPASVTGTPSPFKDPTVTIMESFYSPSSDHVHELHNQGGNFETYSVILEEEEDTGMREGVVYHTDVSDIDQDLRSPLLSSPPGQAYADIPRGDSFKSSKANARDLLATPNRGHGGSIGSVRIGGGWHLAFQWTGPEGTEGKPEHGSYKRLYLYQEPQHIGAGSSHLLPRLGSEVSEIESVATAIVSRTTQHGIPNGLAESSFKAPAWSELLEGGVKQALIVGVTLQILMQFCGINAVLSFTPKVLQESGAEVLLSKIGIGSNSASILASAVVSLVSVPFITLAMHLMDVAGRRKILLHALPIIFLALICFTIIRMVPTSETLFASVSVLSVVVYMTVFMMGFGPIPNMICAEIFPTRVRGICVTICQAAMWIARVLVTEFFPVLDSALGIASTFAIFAVVCIITLLFVYFIVPETKGLPLEIITELFALSAAEKKRPAST